MLAVLAVLAVHGGAPVPGGFFGVDVFFVLSGFLITTLLMEEWVYAGRVSLRAFYVRRARRLLPALAVTLIGVAALYAALPSVDRGIGLMPSVLAVIGYAGNWVEATGSHGATGNLGALDPTWSLAIEEQFYLLWPISLLYLLRRGYGGSRLARALCAAAAVSVALRIATWFGLLPLSAYFSTHTHADGILLGCALAVVLRNADMHARIASLPSASGLIAVATLLILMLTLHTADDATYVAGFAAAALASAVLIAQIVTRPDTWIVGLFASPSAAWLGARSYGIYLYHWPIFLMLTRDRTHMRYVELFPLRVVVTVAVAAVSYKLIERPLRHRRRREIPTLAVDPRGS